MMVDFITPQIFYWCYFMVSPGNHHKPQHIIWISLKSQKFTAKSPVFVTKKHRGCPISRCASCWRWWKLFLRAFQGPKKHGLFNTWFRGLFMGDVWILLISAHNFWKTMLGIISPIDSQGLLNEGNSSRCYSFGRASAVKSFSKRM